MAWKGSGVQFPSAPRTVSVQSRAVHRHDVAWRQAPFELVRERPQAVQHAVGQGSTPWATGLSSSARRRRSTRQAIGTSRRRRSLRSRRVTCSANLDQGGSLLYLGGNGIYENGEYEPDQTGMVFRQGIEGGPRVTSLFRVLDPAMPERSLLGVATERCGVEGSAYSIDAADHSGGGRCLVCAGRLRNRGQRDSGLVPA
jgi:hypothetical protein